jgi:hypothetical protein
MHKVSRHKFLVCFFLLLALLNFGKAGAQDGDSSGYMPEVRVTENFDTGNLQQVTVRPISDTTLRRVRNDDAYWYANLPPKKPLPRPKEQKSFFDKDWVRTLLWILIVACFVGALIWYLSSSNIRLFRKASPPLVMEEDLPMSEDIFSLDYDKALRDALAAGNYRLAIRLLYLGTLKDLSERGRITYTQEKTNSDYLSQLYNTPYYRSFFRLTRDFEYSWYGQFSITGDTFAVVQKEFADFKQLLRS